VDLRTNAPRVAALVGAGAAGAGVALAVAIGLGGVGGTSTTTVREIRESVSTSPAASTVGTTTKRVSIYDIYSRTAPGVVQITATSVITIPSDPFSNPFGPSVERQRALGSGFVISKAGYVVTNYHVVAGAGSVQVSFSNNESMKARIIGSDPSTDLSVLQVNANSRALTPLIFGDSDAVRVGDPVIAIGNPFGLSRTVTSGIVSALQRQITSPNQYTIDHVIQTDAAINHGNSGGPLLDAGGEVIGVNAQIDTGNTGEQGNVGIGFAIPSNTVKNVVAQLIKNGKVAHAYLGISAQLITPDLVKTIKLPTRSGLLVESVQAGSPAANAGLRGGTREVTVAGETYTLGGDMIVRADGVLVGSLARLRDVLSMKKPGDSMTLVIFRDAKKTTIKVKLGRQPSSPSR
jgi:S1-C subfamily serine protease